LNINISNWDANTTIIATTTTASTHKKSDQINMIKSDTYKGKNLTKMNLYQLNAVVQ